MFLSKKLVSVRTLGILVVGAVLGGVSVLAVREAASPAGSSQAGQSHFLTYQYEAKPYHTVAPPFEKGSGTGVYKFSSKAVADECGAVTQINWNQVGSTGSPNYGLRPFLPVNGKGGEDLAGPYEPIFPWPQPVHNDYTFGGQGGIFVDSPDRVYVFQRDEQPAPTTPFRKAGSLWGTYTITEMMGTGSFRGSRNTEHHLMVFDRQGKLVDWWKQWDALFTEHGPSRINISRYDPDRHFWMIHGQKITKFTHDGKKIVMQLDNKDPNGKPIGFHGGIAWLPNGDFFVIGTNRAVKFSKEGKYLSEFGSHGAGPGQFNGGTQGLVIHPDTRRLYVGDRNNSRLQVFDENGKYLDEWPNIMAVYILRLTKDNHMWVADALTHKFLKYDLNGKLITSFGTFGIAPGAVWGFHYFDVDNEGALYQVSDYAGGYGAIQKWVPRKDIDPSDPRLIGPLVQ